MESSNLDDESHILEIQSIEDTRMGHNKVVNRHPLNFQRSQVMTNSNRKRIADNGRDPNDRERSTSQMHVCEILK